MSLTKWFKEDWVDISAPKKGGGYEKCGRESASRESGRGYPKCVPSAKAAKMTASQRSSAVRRKRSKPQGVGGKPTMVATYASSGGFARKLNKGCGAVMEDRRKRTKYS